MKKALNYKRLALIVAVVAASTLNWAIARMWLDDPARFSSILVMLWPAVAFIVSAAVTAVAFLLMEQRWDRLAAILASWATFIIFWPPDVWYISALPVFVGFWWWAGRDLRHGLRDRQRIRVRSTLEYGTRLILLGAFLMVSLGFYLLPSSKKLNATTVSRDVQESFEAAYDNPLVERQLSQLPPDARAQVQRDVSQYVYQTARSWLAPVGAYLPPLLAFALFLALWSVQLFVRWPAQWLGTGLFHLLKRTGFIQVQEQDVKGEVVSL